MRKGARQPDLLVHLLEVEQRLELVDPGARLRECAEQLEAAAMQLLAAVLEPVDLLLVDAPLRRLVLNLVRGIAVCEARRVRIRSARQSAAQHARAAQAACGGTGGLAMNAPAGSMNAHRAADGRGVGRARGAREQCSCPEALALRRRPRTPRILCHTPCPHRSLAPSSECSTSFAHRHPNAPATGSLAMGSTGSARGTAALRSGFTMGAAAAPPVGKRAASEKKKLTATKLAGG